MLLIILLLEFVWQKYFLHPLSTGVCDQFGLSAIELLTYRIEYDNNINVTQSS